VGVRSTAFIRTTLAVCGFGLIACQSGDDGTVDEHEHPAHTDQAAAGAGKRAARVDRDDLPELCLRPGSDAVRDLFCGTEAPQIGSLYDLQSRLGLVFQEADLGPVDQLPMVAFYEDFPALALVLLNTSTALSGRLVSTLNPRAIILARPATMAFNRGIQRVELLSRDREDSYLNFYLVTFEQACNASAAGCSPGDLYTPRVESDWTSVRIEDDEQLKNTEFDCRQCHQRGLEHPIMLMRELDGPWTHFFMPDQDQPEGNPEASGVDVARAYYLAKGDEPYGNIPWAAIRATVGFTLQSVVERPQPLVFDGSAVFNERWPWTKGRGYPAEPEASATWYREFENFRRGEHLALPYFDPFPSDRDKLAELTEVYQRFRGGEISADELPDLGDVYPDDPQTLAEIGFQTEPGATPAQTLVQACGSCHNDVLDQTISRARFSIDLTRLDRAALDLAIARIELPFDAPGHMPPRESRQLDANALEPLVGYLRDARLSADEGALLRRAAQIGMANPLNQPSDL
jgi:hypothetical protein